MPTSEPCGSLPVTTIHVGAHYCHHHMAWTADWFAYRQDEGEDPERIDGGIMRFGPFDTEDEVRAWMLRALLAMEDLTP